MLATTSIAKQELNLSNSNFATESGTCLWKKFEDKLPNNVLLLIIGMSTPCVDVGEHVVY